ncbi:acyltransferase [Paracoccaceae bacterium]|nr:acyltransferase [Paracoccaceae bacterium]
MLSLIELRFLYRLRRKIGTGLLITNIFARYVLSFNRSFKYPSNFTSRISYGQKLNIIDDGSSELMKCLNLSGGFYLQARSGISIHSSVHLAPGVKIISENHDIRNKGSHLPSAPIVIEKNVWLAANCIILPGVTVGENSVIAAGAIVTKSVPKNHKAIGVPAKNFAL